ncbi:MAG: TonB-dependent receptor [Steroidobacteraceae bacterium]
MRYRSFRFTVAHLCACTLTLALAAPCGRAADLSSRTAAGDHVRPSSSAPDDGPTADPSGTSSTSDSIQTVLVTAKRLNAARSEIETETGASTYTIGQSTIAAEPGGENVQLNQVLLQAPDVVQDSFGQIHVRGDHNDLQYRLNGIIIPEGINVFGQTLDPRLLSSVSLITGALPAEYGLRTAGVIDMSTNSGVLQPGGYVSIYGGSHGTIQPSLAYGGGSGSLNYYLTYDELINDLGIESPDESVTPLHDHSTQGHGFAYLEDILDSNDRVSLILGTSDDEYQIPNVPGEQPPLGYTVNGVQSFLSNDLDESQHELTQYGIFSWQHSEGALNWQSSLSARYTSLHFAPDWTGDLLYNGIAQDAFKVDTAVGWQTDASYRLSEAHTLRFGWYLQHDSSTSDTTSQVLPIDPTGAQTSDVPLTVLQNGTQSQEIESAYVQDEWKPLTALTVNYGLRFDHYNAYSSGSQISPRLNVVWQVLPDTTVHAGYSRYFTPPPFELVASGTFTRFAGTSAEPPGTETEDTAPIAERSDYYDFGVEQKLLAQRLTLGVDSYYENAQHLIDEGQFGAPIILTPFNYRYGKIEGLELTSNYTVRDFSAYANLAFQSAKGKDVESSQFNFGADDLAYIADNYIHLDHEERVSGSGGVSYTRWGTRLSADAIFGTGLRDDLLLPSGFAIPNGDHTPSYTQVNLGASHAFIIDGSGPLTVRLDVINLFDKIYQIRSGTGIGVFAPQYGARRGVFAGLEWDF